MTRVLTLSIDAFTLTLGDGSTSRFAQNGYERVISSTGETEYSLFGTPIDDGNLYESKFVWTLQAYVAVDQWRILWGIFQRSERKRRNQQDYSITISDYVLPYIEDATTPSRSLASGGSIATISGGGIAYPAVYKCRMFEPKAEESGSLRYKYLARFVLKELDRVSA
jgi:hypothetical protein